MASKRIKPKAPEPFLTQEVNTDSMTSKNAALPVKKK